MFAQRLVLASGSPYRKQLLDRLGLDFAVAKPAVDEAVLPGETAEPLVLRLSRIKAEAVRAEYPDALIIGSDQVGSFDGEIFGKPGDHEHAIAQLSRFSGRRVDFLTGLCLLNGATGQLQSAVVSCTAVFRALDAGQIDSYLRRERPYQCAGSLMSEGLGISLLERLISDDPTVLIGLPLIRLIDMLEREGVRVI